MSDGIDGEVIFHPNFNQDGPMMVPAPKNPDRIKKWGPDRDAQAARMKALGYTLPEICEALELGPDTRRAGAAIRRALTNMVRFAQDEMRVMELMSLEELEAQAWRTLRNAHVIVSNGHIVHDETGMPLQDDRYILEMIDRVVRIKERRAKMMGLDAPSRAEVISIDSIDSEIAKLEAEIERAKPGKKPADPPKQIEGGQEE